MTKRFIITLEGERDPMYLNRMRPLNEFLQDMHDLDMWHQERSEKIQRIAREIELLLFNTEHYYCLMHRAISRPDFEIQDQYAALHSELKEARQIEGYAIFGVANCPRILRKLLDEKVPYAFKGHTEHHDWYHNADGTLKFPIPHPKVQYDS